MYYGFSRIYFALKPLAPLPLRLKLRRFLVKLKRTSCEDVWPIHEKAGTKPPGWPGWPDGKRFGFILSHDVEGRRGLGRVEQLMRLEKKYGFRSSFNFVPKGEYSVPKAVRETLKRAGFEVGVHGLEHDGRLYNSKAGFALKADQINGYLENWEASGFRSPLMQHRLSWLHRLRAVYDSSTFDTDPFEPEPDGMGTVFPFWVPGPKGTGFVELPYTLPQDHTLFAVLREPNIDIWKRKLDWIAERGGMALLNSHPDYMCFDGNGNGVDEFPASYYEEFLSYAREKYESAAWFALPREVARFYCDNVPLSSRNSRKKICMVSHNSYQSDNRVRRYAEALAKRGDHVDVIVNTGPEVPVGVEEINGVTVHRIQRRLRDERGKWTHALRLIRFLASASLCLMRLHNKHRYDLIHVHNIPDFMVFSAWYPKWTGAKVILDIHDMVPEFFASKFGTTNDDRWVRWLKRVEKLSARFADHVIVSNHLWYETLVARSVPKQKCSVFINQVDPGIFYPRRRTRNDGKFIILFPGGFYWHQGLDIGIKAFSQVREKVPNAELHLYGGGAAIADLVNLSDALGLNGSVKFCGGFALDYIADVMANADLGIVPKRADSFGNEAYSTKIMEFMSQGLPVVVSRTKIDEFYFDESVVRFFSSGDPNAMAEAMLEVIGNKELREAQIAAAYRYVERNNWELRKRDYLALVDTLSTEAFDSSDTAVEVDTVA